jgi:hypothetical protein
MQSMVEKKASNITLPKSIYELDRRLLTWILLAINKPLPSLAFAIVRGRLRQLPDSLYHHRFPSEKGELFKLVYYDHVPNFTRLKHSLLHQRLTFYAPDITGPSCCNIKVILDRLPDEVKMM